MVEFPEGEILVMARAPEPGRAKTRLIPALGEEGAANLHRLLVERLLHELCEGAVAPVTLCCTPDTAHPFFTQCRERYGVSLQQQQGNGLGERLHYALGSALRRSRYALVIGCDIPQLKSDDLSTAFKLLQGGKQAVISPTEDGGYALLGIALPEVRLFEQVEWGSERVMAQTRNRLGRLGWSWSELREQWDIDTPDQLPRLRALKLSPQIEKLLSSPEPVN